AMIAVVYALSIPMMFEIGHSAGTRWSSHSLGVGRGALHGLRVEDASDPAAWTASAGWSASGWRMSLPPAVTRGPGIAFTVVPLWIPLALVVTPTCWLFWTERRRRARSPSACRTCGYDLSGLAGGRCPECGAAALAN